MIPQPDQAPLLRLLGLKENEEAPFFLATAIPAVLERVRQDGITETELAKAKKQLKTRLVFDNDSITNIAHQLGYFETIASVETFLSLYDRIADVTLEAAAATAQKTFEPSNRTIGWFDPQPPVSHHTA